MSSLILSFRFHTSECPFTDGVMSECCLYYNPFIHVLGGRVLRGRLCETAQIDKGHYQRQSSCRLECE